uniref:Zgc:194398 n=1 Tax=Sinocyclocheilus grahami TaxID=75366 RepID=A0A672MP59_SINGR
MELDKAYKSGYQLCNLTSEEDKQDMTFEEQKPTNYLEGQNDEKEREIVEEYKVVIDEDVEETVTSGEHPKARTMDYKTNIIQKTENDHDISLKEKKMDSDVDMSSFDQEAPEAAQEILEEEASASTERSLRCRTIKVQSPPIRKSRRVQKQVAEGFEAKTGTVPLTGRADEEVHEGGAENVVSLIEGEPDEDMESKEMDEVSVVNNEQTYVIEESTIQLELVKEAEMSGNEETSSMTAKTVNVCVPVTIVTNVKKLDEDGDMVSVKVVEGGAQNEEKAEPSQENTDQEQEEEVSLSENMGETNLTNEYKTTAVEGKFALKCSDQEAAFITRSLRYQTVTVQPTPRSKSKRLHRKELVSERETDGLNVPTGKENEALIAKECTAEFENLVTNEGEGIIQTNADEKSEKSGTKDYTNEDGSEMLFEIMESNSGSRVNTEQNKSQEENLERENVPVPNEQEEEDVSSVQEEANPLQERENEGATEGVQGSSADVEETAVEWRTLRKRTTVETAAPRKSKRLRKQEHDDDSKQVKEAVMGQTDSVEVIFTADDVELNTNSEEILQKIQKNEQKQIRLNKTQTDEDNEEVVTVEIGEEAIEQHVDLESSTNEGFTLALEVKGTSDQEENKADEERRVMMEAPKEIFTSAEKGEENISDDV